MPALPPKTDIKSAPNQNLWLYGFGSQVVTVALLGLLESDPVPASVAREPRQTGCASVFEIINRCYLFVGDQYHQPFSRLLHVRKRAPGDRESRSTNAWLCSLCAKAANYPKATHRPASLQPRALGAANESGNDLCNVRFGSKADKTSCRPRVRFTSGTPCPLFPQKRTLLEAKRA